MKINKKQLEAAKLLEGALQGDTRSVSALVEGISTSDIPVQLTPTLSRIALNNYNTVEKVWTDWASRYTVDNFESNPMYNFEWGDDVVERNTGGKNFVSGSLPHIPEYDEYPVLNLQAAEKTIQTRKSGAQVKFSWEALRLSRNFNLINSAFGEFGRRAAFLENEEATRPLVTESGLNVVNFNAGNQNILTGNPALTLDALEAAVEALNNQTYNGRRLPAPSQYVLVVPRSLEIQAQRILAVNEVQQVQGAGTADEIRWVSGNPIAGKFKLVVNDYISSIAGSQADGFWFILPAPGNNVLDQTVVNVFLAGHETPRVFVQKTTNSAPEDGAFIDDSYSTKVRHVVAGDMVSPYGTLFSDGSGS